MKKIYIVRHGQTDFNLNNIVQGSGVDSSLNDKGRAQARAFYEAYRHIKFDKVYTSVLQRTIQTVQQFISDGVPHQSFPGLNEISWGKKEGFAITPDEDEYYHYMLREWRNGNTNLKIEGGESPEEVAKRMAPVMDTILRQTHEKNVLICMHGRAIRILLCNLLHYPLRCMDMFEHQNLCLYRLDYTGTMFSLQAHNDTAHLRSLS